MSGRLVWVSDEETIERLGAVAFARLVTRRRLAAPADPAEAVMHATYMLRQFSRGDAAAVLQALGVPSLSPTRSDNP